MSTTRGKPRQRTGASRSRSKRVGFVAAGGATLALVVVAALVLANWGDDSPGAESASEDPGVAHVHGLGINPADETLYVATHHGTFRIPAGGDAVRLGDSLQDTMGFTVVGPDHFLGSGHPGVAGMQAGQPGLLGLIESTDGGATWEPLSLSGEVDFHGLAYAHDQVYGWDSTSGSFMVSADRRTWDTRSTVGLYGFAVDPADAEHIVGASEQGLVRSRDGGRSWQPVEGPALVALTWTDTGIWGADPAGAVRRSLDGITWTPRGELPGPPQALAAHDNALYAAAQETDGTGIYRSDDQGQTWQLLYRDQTQ